MCAVSSKKESKHFFFGGGDARVIGKKRIGQRLDPVGRLAAINGAFPRKKEVFHVVSHKTARKDKPKIFPRIGGNGIIFMRLIGRDKKHIVFLQIVFFIVDKQRPAAV